MKLKTASIYLLTFLGLCAMFSTCYYLSYRHALNDFNKRAIQRDQNYAAIDTKAQPTKAVTPEKTADVIEQPEIVQPTTSYVLESYDVKTNKLTSENLNPPAYIVGLTREEIIKYLDEYMKDMPLSEYNKGLISFELLNFSPTKVVVRKSYNEDTVPFRFYVVVKNGFVVVYNSDLKSVYSYTQIAAKDLPEEDRMKLSQGIYVNNLDDLYALLESYSS